MIVRLTYFVFIIVGLFGEMGVLGDKFKSAVNWSPYGSVKNILAASLEPARCDNHTTLALLLTIGYTIVFATLGIRWFKWSTK